MNEEYELVRSIKIKHSALERLINRLEQEEGRNRARIPMLRRKHFGFSVRHHRAWLEGNQVMLDFDDAATKTIFLLKYSDLL
jgi:hypothetical protein